MYCNISDHHDQNFRKVSTKGGQQIGSNESRKSQNKIKNKSSGWGRGGGNVRGYYWC